MTRVNADRNDRSGKSVAQKLPLGPWFGVAGKCSRCNMNCSQGWS